MWRQQPEILRWGKRSNGHIHQPMLVMTSDAATAIPIIASLMRFRGDAGSNTLAAGKAAMAREDSA